MGYRIVVVDDDNTNLRMAGHILRKNGMTVTALPSGRALLSELSENGQPDLILLDINMPEMDGFETLAAVRDKERARGLEETPVIFLTADEETETETHSFEAGVSDYIKKPFNPDILLSRINNIVSRQDTIKNLRTEASTDTLTGLLNKGAAGNELKHLCDTETGCLMMIDLDSFKLVNDIYGHEMGDRVLIAFSEMIRAELPEGSRCGRMGGDEFAAFSCGYRSEREVKSLAERLNAHILSEARRLMGGDMEIPLGVSVGGVFVPEYGRDYETLLGLADKSLYEVKQNGKHGAAVYSEGSSEGDAEIDSVEKELATLSAILGERNIPNSALRLEKQIFSSVYQYIMRYVIRNRRKACKVLLTIVRGENTDPAVYEGLCTEFGEHIKNCLRKSDILMRSRHDQYFVLLADIREDSVEAVVGNLVNSWKELHGGETEIVYVTEFVGGRGDAGEPVKESRVLVVDNSIDELKELGRLLSGGGFYVTAMRTAQSLFDHLNRHTPELMIIDAGLPSTDITEIMNTLREFGGDTADVPVLILTSDSDSEQAKNALLHGAYDIIRKPFIPEAVLQRVRNAVELAALRGSMSIEVEKRLRGSSELFLKVIRSFSELIDAKDSRVCGHSLRVAEYSREIARRAGLPPKRQNDIYTAALLHDVGKLGIPDELLGKPAPLTGEEFEKIKEHSLLGAKALEGINGMPVLAAGARWHHERFGGGGYPDGLRGEDIPDEARIIAVADAYTAMTGSCAYKGRLTPAQAAEELRRGRGTQFDPVYADIMLEITADDSADTADAAGEE